MAGASLVYTGGGATVVMDPPPMVYINVFRSGSGPERHLRRKAEAVAVKARELAPRGKTRRLANSIRVDQNRDERGRFAFGFKVYTPIYYGYYVHEGTGPDFRSKFPGAMRFPGTKKFKGQIIFTERVNHPGTPAQPFLQNALVAMAG